MSKGFVRHGGFQVRKAEGRFLGLFRPRPPALGYTVPIRGRESTRNRRCFSSLPVAYNARPGESGKKSWGHRYQVFTRMPHEIRITSLSSGILSYAIIKVEFDPTERIRSGPASRGLTHLLMPKAPCSLPYAVVKVGCNADWQLSLSTGF